MIRVGQKVTFDPNLTIKGFGVGEIRGENVTGTVVSLNVPHQWFSVEYNCFGVKQRTSFKFCQMGKDVWHCGSL